MSRLWSWLRATQPRSVVPDPDAPMPYGPYSHVIVYNDALKPNAAGGPEGSAVGWIVAARNFVDPAEAKLCGEAWRRHAPTLSVDVRHRNSSSTEPSCEGYYLGADGTQRTGQPAAITELMVALTPPSPEELAARRKAFLEQRRLEEEAREARAPKDVVLAQAGDDSPVAHHPKFVKATQLRLHDGQPIGRVLFHFTEFTGYEPEPVRPAHVAGGTDAEQAQRRLCAEEYSAASILWHKAKFRLQVAPMLETAAAAWPAVAEAFTRIEQTWSDLDHPPHGWEAALKQLLDAHKHAEKLVRDWEDRHARALATTGAEIARDLGTELDELRDKLGTELDIDVRSWDIGLVDDPANRYCRIEYGAKTRLEDLIRSQREQLAEIAQFTPGRAPAGR